MVCKIMFEANRMFVMLFVKFKVCRYLAVSVRSLRKDILFSTF
jgi:hypothetical protein